MLKSTDTKPKHENLRNNTSSLDLRERHTNIN